MYWYMYLQFAIVNFSERLENINIFKVIPQYCIAHPYCA